VYKLLYHTKTTFTDTWFQYPYTLKYVESLSIQWRDYGST